MAKRKNKTKAKRRGKGSSAGGISTGSIFKGIGLAVAGFLVTNYGSKMIQGEKTIEEAGITILAPQAIGIASPLLMKKKARTLLPVAIGSGIALLLGLIETLPKDEKQKAKLTKMALLNGDLYDGEDVIDLSDLTPDQQKLIGQYVMTGMSNSDPLGQDQYVVTGDNSDPLA